jgi:hypothetical protein
MYALWPAGAKVAATTRPAAVEPQSRENDAPPAPQPAVEAEANTEVKPAAIDPYAPEHSATSSEASEKAVPKTNPPPAESVANQNSPVASPGESTKASLPNPPAAPIAAPAAAPADAAERPDAATVTTSGDKHVLKFDPLDFDPDHLSLGSTSSKPTALPPPAPTGSISANAATDAAPSAKADINDKPPVPGNLLPPPVDANLPIKSRRGPIVDDPSRAVTAAERLATRVKSLSLAEMPLARFAEILSAMTGVPITLDPITLELNGVSPRDPVSANATDMTLDKILRDALAAHRLELVDQNGAAFVAIPDATQQRSVDFDVKDLAPGGDASGVAGLVERFVAPTIWKTAGGNGSIKVDGTTLHVDAPLLARREALIFCERLRLARGLQRRSKYPAALLTIESPLEKLGPILDKPTTFTFMPWTRIADVVHQWQELTGITILVDWSALADAEFTPSSTVACSAIDRPWSESLDGVLTPLGLGWWAVDGQTIQITTLDGLERFERVEFYPISPKLREQYAKDDALLTALQEAVSSRPGDHADARPCELTVDQPGGRLIVRASPLVHRFLYEWLRNSAEPLAKHE